MCEPVLYLLTTAHPPLQYKLQQRSILHGIITISLDRVHALFIIMATPDISSEDDLYDQGLIFPVSPLDTNYDRDDYATLKIIVGPKRENFYFPK